MTGLGQRVLQSIPRIDVPPGDVTVEVLGMNTASLKGGSVSASDGIVCVGGRELVILKMMR